MERFKVNGDANNCRNCDMQTPIGTQQMCNRYYREIKFIEDCDGPWLHIQVTKPEPQRFPQKYQVPRHFQGETQII